MIMGASCATQCALIEDLPGNYAVELRAGRARVFALLFDMNLLWERYIAVLLRRVVGRAGA